MKILKLLAALALMAPGAASADIFNYGFGPADAEVETLLARGSGSNTDLEAALRLSPAENTQIAALKGAKITGLRFMLRCSAARAGKVQARIGDITADPIAEKSNVRMFEGWNEVTFAEPIEIGTDDIYLLFRVNETQGQSGHHPILMDRNPAPSATQFMHIAASPWDDCSASGTIMMQAIIDGDPTVLAAPAAAAVVYDAPLQVAPNQPFGCSIHLRNLSTTPIQSVTVNSGVERKQFDVNIPALSSTTLTTELLADSILGSGIPFTTCVDAINGAPVTPAISSTTPLLVTADAFERIPLIEEFTGLTCGNCPIMAYYLEDALKEFGHPYVYVARHAGFEPDEITIPSDKALLRFFTGDSYNPAVMYDRSLLTGETEIIHGVREYSSKQYVTALNDARLRPALARVDVEMDGNNFTVSGKVTTGAATADGKVHLSVYLVEDNIKPSLTYMPQSGVQYQGYDDAPEDMVDRFRHNGVIRHDFCASANGDSLKFDAEGYFSENFTLPKLDSKWNKQNMHIVAFVHRYNNSNLLDNYVFNAGTGPHLEQSGIAQVEADHNTLILSRTPQGGIVAQTPVRSLEVYTLNGLKVSSSRPGPRGIYIIRATLPDSKLITTRRHL